MVADAQAQAAITTRQIAQDDDAATKDGASNALIVTMLPN
jgi:hypothetical protein